MTKKDKKSKASDSKIESNSLLSARHRGDKPVMPFPVKREPIENEASEEIEVDFPINNEEVVDLFNVIRDAKNRATIFEGSNSNHSVTSTCTEPCIDNRRNIADLCSQTNNMGRTSFEHILIKKRRENA